MKNIYVGNLSYQTTEHELQALFEQYGTVRTAKIMTDLHSGASRGFAFIEMLDDQQAMHALDALNGKEVGGRALIVNEARVSDGEQDGRQRRERG